MTKIGRRAIAVGGITALAAFGTAGAALAANATPPTKTPMSTAAPAATWQQVHDKLAKALAARQALLATLASSVASHKHLTATDRTALQNLLGPETQGINQLAATVATATPQNTTIAQLRQDARTLVDQYRVHEVMVPQVHLVTAADTQTDVEVKLAGLEPKLQAAIAKAGNPSDAVQAYRDLVTEVTKAATATGQANVAAVLKVTPPGYPADGGPLVTARTALHSAQDDLKSARADIKIIRNALRPGHAAKATTTTP